MTHEGVHNIALANRPLPGIHKCNCALDERHNLNNIKPSYDIGETYHSFNDSGKEIPVVIKKNFNGYYVLENKDGYYDDVEENIYNDIWNNRDPSISKPVELNMENNPSKKVKMNMVTQFYVGSLSIVGLYILYRVIQKTR